MAQTKSDWSIDTTRGAWEDKVPMTRIEAMNKAAHHAQAGHVLLETLPENADPLFAISQAQVHATLAHAFVTIASDGKFMRDGNVPRVPAPAPRPSPANHGKPEGGRWGGFFRG